MGCCNIRYVRCGTDSFCAWKYTVQKINLACLGLYIYSQKEKFEFSKNLLASFVIVYVCSSFEQLGAFVREWRGHIEGLFIVSLGGHVLLNVICQQHCLRRRTCVEFVADICNIIYKTAHLRETGKLFSVLSSRTEAPNCRKVSRHKLQEAS